MDVIPDDGLSIPDDVSSCRDNNGWNAYSYIPLPSSFAQGKSTERCHFFKYLGWHPSQLQDGENIVEVGVKWDAGQTGQRAEK